MNSRQVEHGFWLKKYLRDVRDYQKRKSSAIERLESGYFLYRINRACLKNVNQIEQRVWE